MRVKGRGHTPSLEGPWGSTSTCSSTCTLNEDPITLQPIWAPHTPWAMAVESPPSWAPSSPPPSSFPSPAQRTDLVRGARGRRSSVVANLLRDGGQNPARGVDVAAFHRYYNGGSSLRGGTSSPGSPAARSACGGGEGVFRANMSSLGDILPTKVESLLKLLAQSIRLVLQALCSRKARRKDRECSSTHEHKLYLEEAVLERNIPETDLRQLVDLPPGLGYEEWLASHTIDFFHNINWLYGTVCEFCTLTGCPDMTGPGLRQYLWFDEKGKKTRVAASQYVDYVMTFTQNTVNDEAIFPTKFDNDFPSSFESIVKKIHRLLFHVVAHLYHAHFREVALLSLHAHLNCIFAHFVLFNEKFRLVDPKETEILHDLVLALKIHPPDTTCPPDHSPLTSSNDLQQAGAGGDRGSSPIPCPTAGISEGSSHHGSGSPATAREDGGSFPGGSPATNGVGKDGLTLGTLESGTGVGAPSSAVYDNRVSLADAFP